MPRKQEARRTLVVADWHVEERRAKRFKVMEIDGSRQFTVHQASPKKYRVSGKNSKGSLVRERFASDNIETAVLHAASVLYGDPMPNLLDPREMDLADAFARAIAAGHGQPENKRNQLRYALYFVKWAVGEGLERWCQIRRTDIDGYVNELARRGLKRKTIRNYLEPVRTTGARMHEDFPELHNPLASFRLRKGLGDSYRYDDHFGNEALSFEEVLALSEWLKAHRHGRVLRLGVLLSGLMGLRQREAIFLTWKNVDLEDGTLTIQEEDGHKPKNTYSIRRLPVPKIILSELRGIPSAQRTGRVIRPEELKKFHRCKDENFAYDLSHYYSLSLNAALKEWRKGIRLSAKDLRRTIQTHALDNPGNWNQMLVDRYCGHAPTTMMERHYFADQRKRLVGLFRRHVTPMIDAEVEAALAAKSEVQKCIKMHNPEGAPPGQPSKIIEIADLA
ncbi:site-specific integrase [bacterium]|nr:site-specific integrase [bacterium]